MEYLSTSYREVSLNATLTKARQFAAQLGISRITDITKLDRIDIPVFASIRPNAHPRSLCVNAGKGVTEKEAQVSAYMEAIEYAAAEQNRNGIRILTATPIKVLDGQQRKTAILDFCPLINTEVDLNLPISVVQAEDILHYCPTFVPAELVFLPFISNQIQDSIFGSTSNGLASGNSVQEATLQAVLEVIERDISSFQLIKDTSYLVVPESLSELAMSLVKKITKAGLKIYLRYVYNPYKVAYFAAIIFDLDSFNPLYINAGFGCHPNKNVAIMRAICEAAQSRLSFIHGAREDLQKTVERFANLTELEIEQFIQQRYQEASSTHKTIHFSDIQDFSKNLNSIPQLLNNVIINIKANNINSICRIVLTKESDPLSVIRIIIPKMENFNAASLRVGIRLRNYANSL
ncbi:MAG: YcaO-like family protein [Xenococcaceae cyanobacterium MO_167.B52]|nr:YcaO-like family protein [Xenococcaceae cyanobacterium MO_167.B52]